MCLEAGDPEPARTQEHPWISQVPWGWTWLFPLPWSFLTTGRPSLWFLGAHSLGWEDEHSAQACDWIPSACWNLKLFWGLAECPEVGPDCFPHGGVSSHLGNTVTDVLGPTVWPVGQCAVTAALMIRQCVISATILPVFLVSQFHTYRHSFDCTSSLSILSSPWRSHL